MKVCKIVLLVFLLAATWMAHAANDSRVVFSPASDVQAVVETKGRSLLWRSEREG